MIRGPRCAARSGAARLPLILAQLVQGELEILLLPGGVMNPDKLRTNERDTFLKERWPEICAHMRRLGLQPEDLVERALA